MPDSDKMMYQTPFWGSTFTGGRDVYAPQREAITHGQVDRWILPRFGQQGWPWFYEQPAPPDPELLRMGFQQTGIFGGPAGRAELYRGPQVPPIGVPIGFDKGFEGLSGLGCPRLRVNVGQALGQPPGTVYEEAVSYGPLPSPRRVGFANETLRPPGSFSRYKPTRFRPSPRRVRRIPVPRRSARPSRRLIPQQRSYPRRVPSKGRSTPTTLGDAAGIATLGGMVLLAGALWIGVPVLMAALKGNRR